MPLNRPIRDWHERRVWIVGASSGIGAALARELAAAGAELVVTARGRERLEGVANEIGARPVVADVADRAELARAAGEALATLGRFDLVVFNAGTYVPTRAWELHADRIDAALAVNVGGVMHGVATVVPGMLERGEGAIAVVASVAGYRGLPKALVYGPSKAALINFAEALHMDLAPRGVSVFLVNPGFVDTGLTRQNDFHMPALISPEEAAREIVAGMARGRFEIHFPRRFTRFMKLLACLPAGVYLRLVRRFAGVTEENRDEGAGPGARR